MDRYSIALGKEPPPEEPKKPRTPRKSKTKKLEEKLIAEEMSKTNEVYRSMARFFTPEIMETYFDFVAMHGIKKTED